MFTQCQTHILMRIMHQNIREKRVSSASHSFFNYVDFKSALCKMKNKSACHLFTRFPCIFSEEETLGARMQISLIK